MSTAVRCLFSITENDRKLMNQSLDEQARKIDQAETERFMKRWGFDPVKGTTVEGSGFEYTLLDRRTVPAVYTSSYRHKPSRPQSILLARSPARRNFISLSSAPTKRKLRFDEDESGSNDENQDISAYAGIPCKQAKSDSSTMSDLDLGLSEVASPAVTSVINPLSISSPPTSPAASSVDLHIFNSPRSPSVLSSSCPPVLESDLVNDHMCSVDVPGLSRSLSQSTTLVQISPDSQAREYVTPSVRPKPIRLVQREITDYVRIKKHASSLKASPRS